MLFKAATSLLSLAGLVAATKSADPKLANCPGYKAVNVQTTCAGLYANLELAGPACNAYGKDIKSLTLSVRIENGELPSARKQDLGTPD